MKKKALFWFLGFLTLFGVTLGAGWFAFTQMIVAADPTNTATVRFVIPSGQSVQVIATRLQEIGVINNATAFRLLVRQLGLEGNLQAGSFELSPSQTAREIAFTLTQGSEDVWITIPEGLRVEEIGTQLASGALVNFDQDSFIALAKKDEGRLFPDTYLVPKESTAEYIHQLLLKTFEQKIATPLADEIEQSSYSFQELLTMASLVQREARTYEQMRHVSSILWNRVAIGMPLQVDATLQYAKGYDIRTGRWWSPPTSEDKNLASAYNTYQQPGLPKGPICNPGVDAFMATLRPLKTADLFYLHAPSGEMYFGKTLEEHNRNVQRYLR